jgi:hypothetical protein
MKSIYICLFFCFCLIFVVVVVVFLRNAVWFQSREHRHLDIFFFYESEEQENLIIDKRVY